MNRRLVATGSLIVAMASLTGTAAWAGPPVNLSFESGSLSPGWIGGGGNAGGAGVYVLTSPPNSDGNFHAVLGASPMPPAGPPPFPLPLPVQVWLTQSFDLPADATTLSVDVAAGGSGSAVGEILGTWPASALLFSISTAGFGGDYHTFTADVSPMAGTRCTLNFRVENSGYAASYLSIDNVVIVPEPATLSLLVLGGLALARRRRKYLLRCLPKRR